MAYYSNNYSTFDEWYNLIKNNEKVYPRFRIPYEEWLNEYIENIEKKDENEVKELLRYLLFPFTLAKDTREYEDINILLAHSKNNDIERNNLEKHLNSEQYKRIENNQDAWEGLTWVLQFLPYQPYKAIKALNSYLEAESSCMPDDRIFGIEQCISIIEAKFIYTNKEAGNSILQLEPREFEWLIEILYKCIGYKTTLTPATRDGGKDVIAQIDREESKEIVYVECKRYRTTELSNGTVEAFGYNIIKGNINRGVLFCTGYVNSKLRELDRRIQIWSLEEIIVLLNAHIGSDWEKRLDFLIESQRRKYKK